MKQIRLNAFDMNCVGHIQQGLWRHPRDRSAEYTQLEHWTDLARLLERGLFDGLFLADVLGVYDVHGGSPDAAIAHAVQVPVGDPLLLIPAMATVTEHLGFGVTVNLTYEPPFPFARRMSTLDHLTRGRIGWNVVTGYLDSAARAMGLDQQRAHDDRYDVADEYMRVVYALWEGSWAEDAVLRDRMSGRYADPSRVRPIRHAGAHYRAEAIHLCEPSPQRTPVLYQAGSSGRGRRFAGSHAECVFLNGQAKPAVRAHVDAIRAEAAEAGRQGADVLAFVGATVIVAETKALAEAKLADYRRYASPEAALVHASASLGVDLDRYGIDETLGGDSNAIASNLQALAGTTKRQLLERMALGSRQPPIVGDPAAVADALIAWVEEADVDGFILSRTVTPECFADFVELVVPELQRRGAYKESYAPGTLREKLFGGGRLLPDTHPAAAFRFEHVAILYTVALVLTMLLSAAAGWELRRRLHERYLSGDKIESARLLMGMLVTFAALVLGLLTSNAKQRFDGLNDTLSAFGAELIELDHRLRVYGPGAEDIRALLRRYTAAAIADSWPGEKLPSGDYPHITHSGSAGIEGQQLGDLLAEVDVMIEQLAPADVFHRQIAERLRDRVVAAMEQRWRLIFSSQSTVSWPFLLTLTTWMSIIFAIFGLTSPPGRVVYAVVALSALSIASPLYLILDYSEPLTGQLALSSAPMRSALKHMDAE